MGALLLLRQGWASVCHLPAHPWRGRFGLNQAQTGSAWGGEGDATGSACALACARLRGPSLGSLPGSRSRLRVSALLRGHRNSERGLGRDAEGVTHVLERKRVIGHGATWRRCPGPRAQLERPASWRCETDKGPVLRARALTSSHAVPHEYLLSVERSRFLMGWADAARADSEEGLAPPQGPRAGMAPGHSAS